MTHSVNFVQIAVFGSFFLAVTGLGFVASRWKRSGHGGLEEWGLGGRQFGTLVTWFLVGGDFYTAYTMLAIPALVYATGGSGFFALPYTILVYPFVFITMPRLWELCRTHNLMTPADFVKWRYEHRGLALAVAITGIAAVMPYIALQLVGMRGLLDQMGIGGSSAWERQLPLVLSFLFLAAYTYSAGLRAPALLAFVKDTMIYIVVLVAVVVIPARLGGYSAMMKAAATAYSTSPGAAKLVPPLGSSSSYVSLALGSALAAFLYPHTITSVLASSSKDVIRRNAVLLPAYTLLLGLIALLGIAARAAHLHISDSENAIPALFSAMFPAWMSGFSFAAIGIAALVPAAIMSIAAANLFTRNLYKEYAGSQVSDARQTQIARVASVCVTLGALAFVLALPKQFAVNLQLLGGVCILQTLPAVIFGLWPLNLNARALLLGLIGGNVLGITLTALQKGRSSVFPLALGHHHLSVYTGLLAMSGNIGIVAVAQYGWRTDSRA